MQLEYYASVCGNVPRAWLHFNFIFVVLTRGNVTLNIVMGPFVRMTLQRRHSCGESGPFVGIGDVIGLFVGIGPVVGIGLFGGTGLVVSLTYILIFRIFDTKHKFWVLDRTASVRRF